MPAPPLPPPSVMPAAPGAMVPSPPPPSTTAPTCPRPRSPAISSAASSPPSLVISAVVRTWFRSDLRLAARPHPRGPAHDLHRRPHLGQVRSAFGGPSPSSSSSARPRPRPHVLRASRPLQPQGREKEDAPGAATAPRPPVLICARDVNRRVPFATAFSRWKQDLCGGPKASQACLTHVLSLQPRGRRRRR